MFDGYDQRAHFHSLHLEFGSFILDKVLGWSQTKGQNTGKTTKINPIRGGQIRIKLSD